jgi:uncharacterized protein
MSTGLLALLDDVAALAKVAAASLDDAAGQAGKAASKAAGVVIDDTAVTPRYVVGFAAERELPIIGKIALGSLKNKLLLLMPAALALSLLAPWLITPLLMVGGLYLSFEGFEKIAEMVQGGHGEDGEELAGAESAHEFEKQKVRSAVNTDFILSAEIMAITLANVADLPFGNKVFVLAIVGIVVTLGVYGVVALIVKADDVGVAMSRSARLGRAGRALGRGLVAVMPRLLAVLSTVGTAAMLWVGGGILLHGIEGYGFVAVPHALHDAGEAAGALLPAAAPMVSWLVQAAGAAVVGIVTGGIVVALLHVTVRPIWRLVRG